MLAPLNGRLGYEILKPIITMTPEKIMETLSFGAAVTTTTLGLILLALCIYKRVHGAQAELELENRAYNRMLGQG